jgi:thioredoxin-related protein
MGSVTYPDLMVASLLNAYFVPVQVKIDEFSKLAAQYSAIWTPNLNVLDGEENIIYRAEGWLPPSEIAAMLLLARGHYYLRHKKFRDAGPTFDEVFVKYPQSSFAPEALYYKGVSRYLVSHSVSDLKEDWIMLQRFYPTSIWAVRSNI